MRYLWLVLAWLLIAASMAAPQAVYFVSGRSVVLALVTGLLVLGVLGLLLLHHAPTVTHAGIAMGFCATLALLSAQIGTEGYQRAAALGAGRVQDGVALANLERAPVTGTWVRIVDARVRSDAAEVLNFARGDPRKPASQTFSSVTIAPLTLASAVPHEVPSQRPALTGMHKLWACGSRGLVDQFDTERQAVRGVLKPVDDEVRTALRTRLQPAVRAPTPGAGALPAAPGAPAIAPVSAPTPSLAMPDDAWCVDLDLSVDMARARADAIGAPLMFLVMFPLFFVGIIAIIIYAPEKNGAKK